MERVSAHRKQTCVRHLRMRLALHHRRRLVKIQVARLLVPGRYFFRNVRTVISDLPSCVDKSWYLLSTATSLASYKEPDNVAPSTTNPAGDVPNGRDMLFADALKIDVPAAKFIHWFVKRWVSGTTHSNDAPIFRCRQATTGSWTLISFLQTNLLSLQHQMEMVSCKEYVVRQTAKLKFF